MGLVVSSGFLLNSYVTSGFSSIGCDISSGLPARGLPVTSSYSNFNGSCVSVLDHAHVGVDRTLLKTDASDFVIPELDSIGMQKSILGELMMPSYHNGTHGLVLNGYTVRPTNSFGYAPRYAEYKTSFDQIGRAHV